MWDEVEKKAGRTLIRLTVLTDFDFSMLISCCKGSYVCNYQCCFCCKPEGLNLALQITLTVIMNVRVTLVCFIMNDVYWNEVSQLYCDFLEHK